MATKNIAILLFEQVEVLDFAGPFEVFSVANELHQFNLFNVFTVAASDKHIKAVNGLNVITDYHFGDCPSRIDYLVLPGGDGTKQCHNLQSYQDWIAAKYEQAEHVLTVCSGTRFLAALNLLQGKQFCTHQEVYPAIEQLAPDALPQSHLRFVSDGKLTSAGGISAGIDAAFDVLLRIAGPEVANTTATYMEYHRNSAHCGHQYERQSSMVFLHPQKFS